MPCTIIYLKRSEPDRGESWSGTLADAKELARRAVRTNRADQVMIIDDGGVVFHHPTISKRA